MISRPHQTPCPALPFRFRPLCSTLELNFGRNVTQGLRRREEARTRELADNRERLEREDKENKEKSERLKKDLKGRDWVWGPDGEVRFGTCCTHCTCRRNNGLDFLDHT